MSSAICFNLDQSKILSSGNGLKGVNVKQSNPIYSREKRANARKSKIYSIF